ncbi:hypothetical protein CDD80_96 [Ophiocordyceps camponoti-rufipedis]|uniref:Glutamyl-tRNA amidotransferase complex subunit Gta3 domain-containing protein n=1 Tax=Ophiocordyceps camponoti-rufipedis TaxID=2004952 RepID=A0A2C5ZDF5_9HYPO|nr:hypothetical protein CDD80_96 [Ophiocordyceps camponoti-rufipedis]
MLSSPSWSVYSLRTPEPTTEQASLPAIESFSSVHLRHLLRLAALPPPRSEAEERAMIATLQSQLRFVRAVQSVDTAGVDPLCSIRDETVAGVEESTVTLEDVRRFLGEEVPVGHHKRPTRKRSKDCSEAKKGWDPLATAPKKAGKYFVVDCGKGNKGHDAGEDEKGLDNGEGDVSGSGEKNG